MRKVLIITYYWPPGGGAGVQRWLKFVKYMRDFGWEPVVYTAENGEMPVIDKSLEKEVPAGVTVLRRKIWEPYTIYKKFIGRKKEDKINASFLNEGRKAGLAEKISVWIRGNFFIPDARKFWIKPSISFLDSYMREHGIQYMISTGPPHSMHLIAAGLKSADTKRKWIADFRDPWTHIDFYDKLMLTGLADAKHKRLEKSVLHNADIVLSIGEGMSRQFSEIYSGSGGKDTSKFRVITNGFDNEDVSGSRPLQDDKFSIAHIGTLVKDRNPQELWNVLREMVKEKHPLIGALEIKLVGKVDVFVKEKIDEAGLTGYLKLIAYLPHDEVIREQQRSRVLLLLVNKTANAEGILTGKFFEYMSAGAPILAIGPVTGDLATIMKNTGTGLVSGFNDESALRKNIEALFAGKVMSRNETEISKFERRELTGQLCQLLKEL